MRQFAFLALAMLALFLAPASSHAATEQDARQIVEKVGNEALAIIGSQELSKAQKQERLEHLLAGEVDIPWIGRFVLGRYWRGVAEEDRARYLEAYQRFLLSNYTSRFADYTGGSFRIISATNEGDEGFTVNMEIDTLEQKGMLVDYRLHTTPEGALKIYDVIVEGVSLITTQRAEFASVVGQGGLDSLISQLNQKAEIAKRNVGA